MYLFKYISNHFFNNYINIKKPLMTLGQVFSPSRCPLYTLNNNMT